MTGEVNGRTFEVGGVTISAGSTPVTQEFPTGSDEAAEREVTTMKFFQDMLGLRNLFGDPANLRWLDEPAVDSQDSEGASPKSGGKDILKSAAFGEFAVGGAGEDFLSLAQYLTEVPNSQTFMEQFGSQLRTTTSLAGHGGRLMDLLGQEELGALLFAGSKIGGAALNPSLEGIVGALIGLGGRFGGEGMQKFAGEAAFVNSVRSAILNPGPEAIGAVLDGALRRLGVDPVISGGIGFGGQALQVALFGGGPLAAVGLALGFAEMMNRIAGKPSVIQLSTQLDGQKARVEYGISAQEYRTFLDAEGREPRSFNGGVFEMDGKYYLGGSFGYDQLNEITSNGEGGMPGAILGLPGGFIQRRGDGAMMESLEISEELYNQLLAGNGGRKELQAAAGDPIFALVAPRMGLVEEVRYTTTADEGMPSDLIPGVTIFVHPELGEHRSGRDHIGALFSNPLMAGHHHFRDADQAAMFGAFGLMAGMMVAGNPELARSFGGFDAQRMLDHFAANAETMMEGPMFDVYGYLAANPDVAQAVGPNIMDAIRHYLDVGVHEGRSTEATEEAKLGAMARVTGLALYDEATYLALNPDVAEAVARGDFPNGRAHYEAVGLAEKRMAFFDGETYLAANPDVAESIAANGGTALEHYVQFGRAEGRPLAPPAPEAPAGATAAEPLPEGFDAAVYLEMNPDVHEAAKQSGEPLDVYAVRHFQELGSKEGRAFAPAAGPALPEGFDAAIYLERNPDIHEAAKQSGEPLDVYAVRHFQELGIHEGRAYA
jgi:hypothetical protein